MAAPFQVKLTVMAVPKPHQPNAVVAVDGTNITQGQTALVDISGVQAQARLADKSIYVIDSAEMARALAAGWH